jgi:hypothetical protein
VRTVGSALWSLCNLSRSLREDAVFIGSARMLIQENLAGDNDCAAGAKKPGKGRKLG